MTHLSESLEDTSLFWEKLASNPENTDVEACGGAENLFEDLVEFHNDGIILDAGCGYGRFTIPLGNTRRRYMISIDLSSSFLRRLQRNVQMFRLSNINIIRADLRFLPLRQKSLDGLLCWATIYYIPKS